jgi:hypothetical protein
VAASTIGGAKARRAGQVAIDDGMVRVALTAARNFGSLLASPRLLAWSLAVFSMEGGVDGVVIKEGPLAPVRGFNGC